MLLYDPEFFWLYITKQTLHIMTPIKYVLVEIFLSDILNLEDNQKLNITKIGNSIYVPSWSFERLGIDEKRDKLIQQINNYE